MFYFRSLLFFITICYSLLGISYQGYKDCVRSSDRDFIQQLARDNHEKVYHKLMSEGGYKTGQRIISVGVMRYAWHNIAKSKNNSLVWSEHSAHTGTVEVIITMHINRDLPQYSDDEFACCRDKQGGLKLGRLETKLAREWLSDERFKHLERSFLKQLGHKDNKYKIISVGSDIKGTDVLLLFPYENNKTQRSLKQNLLFYTIRTYRGLYNSYVPPLMGKDQQGGI